MKVNGAMRQHMVELNMRIYLGVQFPIKAFVVLYLAIGLRLDESLKTIFPLQMLRFQHFRTCFTFVQTVEPIVI